MPSTDQQASPVNAAKASLVVLDYNDLVSDNVDLTEQLKSAFGAGALGACVVRNVPDYVQKRHELLQLASKLANLPEEVKKEAEHPESSYLFGWSHGKEIMNGKPDFAKGSFYNNPIYDVVPNADAEYVKKFPEYAHPNKWVPALPQLETAFKDLGKMIVQTGQKLAKHCDRYISKEYPDLPPKFMESAIAESTTVKARLLHYFPIEEPATVSSSGNPDDSWCGLHVDHSMLTGLTSAMYVDEANPESYVEVDAVNAASSNPRMAENLAQSGLYIKTRAGNFVKVNIPKDCLAFQIGEAAQVASRGLLVATPHLVKGAGIPAGSGLVIARNTFAVFMQPNVHHKLTPDQTFHQFTEEVMKRHYSDRM
ncbi:hypothetical protein DFJ77DRAFT_425471 [Powellomyces hirtus]|nr:hypothetical protein DFJ77DRAFT_425471 [Powellomyces hirtus]